MRACVPNLLTEFDCFPRRVSANVEHYELVNIRVPQKPRPGEVRGGMDFDSMTPQDASAHLAGSLAAINKENFLPARTRRPRRGGWCIPHLRELESPLGGEWLEGILRAEGGGVKRNRKSPEASRGFLFFEIFRLGLLAAAARIGLPATDCWCMRQR